jgi:hypothetical protein
MPFGIMQTGSTIGRRFVQTGRAGIHTFKEKTKAKTAGILHDNSSRNQ